MAAEESIMSLVADMGLRSDKFIAGLNESKSEFKNLEKLFDTTMAVGVATFTAIGLAAGASFVAIGLGAAEASQQYIDALTDIQAKTGATGKSLEALGVISTNIFVDGLGRDLQDVAGAVSLVRAQIDGLNADEIDEVSRGAIMLRDTFDLDLKESIDAIDQLMGQMGLTSAEAIDFITSGIQRGVNNNNDFIDSIREYSNQFNAAGFNAGEFFSLMETGSAGGVLGTDKAADSIKELINRFAGGDKTLVEGFEAIGFGFEDMQQKVLSGSMDIADVYPQIINRLREMQAAGEDWESAAIGIFGTQAEDLRGFILDMDTGVTSIDELAGAADTLKDRYSSLPQVWENLQRKWQITMVPLGDMLLEGMQRVMPLIENLFTIFEISFTQFVTSFKEVWAESSTAITDAFGRIDEAMGGTLSNIDWMEVGLTALTIGFNAILIGITMATNAIVLFADGMTWVMNRMEPLISGLSRLGDGARNMGEQFPDWMIPSSPPPLAQGLKMISKEAGSLSRELSFIPDIGDRVNTNNNQRIDNSRHLTVNRVGGQELGMQDINTLASLV